MKRYREIVLAVVFLAMALYETLEILLLDLPRGASLSIPVLVHALQVVLILGATWAFLRAFQERTAQQRALARMVEKVLVAQEEERRRIAWDVHDGVAQLIVAAQQHVDAASDLWPGKDPAAARQLERAIDCLKRAIVETRRVLVALRPSRVEAIGLVNAIRESVDEASRQGGWSVHFTEELGDARVPPAVETAAFRILQEALANVLRHARAERVSVRLGQERDWLTLDVSDGGVGFTLAAEDPGGGLGLHSMRERARLLGGSCRVASAPGRGTAVSVRLPLSVGLSSAGTR